MRQSLFLMVFLLLKVDCYIIQYPKPKTPKFITWEEFPRVKTNRDMCECQFLDYNAVPIQMIYQETPIKDCKCGCEEYYHGRKGTCCKQFCEHSESARETDSCFPGDVRLLVYNGKAEGNTHLMINTAKEFEMKDVRAGHRVLTVTDGQIVFSEVKTFLKRQPNKNMTYVTMTTEQGNQVTMSGNHLLFVSTSNQSVAMDTRPAISVKTGEYIFSTKSCPRGLCPERVVQLSLSVKQGLYVPVTDAGTLVVDGVLASCYSFTLHHLEHTFTAPFRWFPWLLEPWQQDGYSPIMSGLEYLGGVLLPRSSLVSVKRFTV